MTGFDRAADCYDQTRGFPAGVGSRVAAALVDFAGIRTGDRILEVGVGTGRIAKPLVALLGDRHHVAGIDVARRMMDRLVATAPPDTRRPDLVQADAMLLPFPDDTFRVVLTVHVLHLLRDWPAAVAEMNRVRAPRGMLIGGWNDHPEESSGSRINRKFRELAVEYGVPLQRQGLADFRDLVPHLAPAAVEEMVAAEWTVERAPRQALQSITERHFSSSWLVPDEVFPGVLSDLEGWAAGQWADLDRLVPEARQFRWMKLVFDSR